MYACIPLDDRDKGSQDVYEFEEDCHAVTEAAKAYQSPRLLRSSKGHFLHCPPKLGKSAKALPAERKTLVITTELQSPIVLQARHVACLGAAQASKEAMRDQIN